MKKRLIRFIVVFLSVTGIVPSWAADYADGRMRLSLNESSGRFSLYYMANTVTKWYVPLFSDKDTRTSSLAVQVNNQIYRMGESPTFTTRLGNDPNTPSFVFDSPGLVVVQEFSFITVAGEDQANGVCMTIRLENRGTRTVNAGVRFILDTSLGEGNSNAHFVTDRRSINTETIADSQWNDKHWISKNDQYGLMGSINTGYSTQAKAVHFANWKLLNDAPWELQYDRRNFNNPSAINDSAVSYIFYIDDIPPRQSRSVVILLAAANSSGFDRVNRNDEAVPPGNSETTMQSPAASRPLSPALETAMRGDLAILRDLYAQLDEYITSGTAVSEDELLKMELLINSIKARYGLW
ncbi:hypothetical protein FACS189473_1710 [Spirochaetia bacterium]|nr:hypothetical protein FACS189473_1710 [Spirochaetia bacterium]